MQEGSDYTHGSLPPNIKSRSYLCTNKMIIKLKYHILVDNAEMAKCGVAEWLNSPVDNNTLTQDQYLDLYQPLTHSG